MSKIFYAGSSIDLAKNETVLQALLRQGIETPYSCESGNCQTCMLKTDSANLPAQSQATLIGKLRAQGYFLPCVCRPDRDINILDGKQVNIYQKVTLIDKHYYNADICRLRFACPENFDYQPGQFINIRSPENPNLVRSYSLCSHPHKDDFLEIQVRHKTNGKLSGYLCDMANSGDLFEISGANGSCYYQSEAQKKLLLIGTNTGIAPLLGIIRDALTKGHTGQICTYYGSRNHSGLYLLEELQSLAEQYENLSLVATLSGEEHEIITQNEAILPGRAHDLAFEQQLDFKQTDLYLCGNVNMVKAAQMQGFMKGVAMANIFTDPFEHQNLRK